MTNQCFSVVCSANSAVTSSLDDSRIIESSVQESEDGSQPDLNENLKNITVIKGDNITITLLEVTYIEEVNIIPVQNNSVFVDVDLTAVRSGNSTSDDIVYESINVS